MEEKKTCKISLGTAICLFIILLLIIVLICVVLYYRGQNKLEIKHTPITTEKFKSYIDGRGFNVADALDIWPNEKSLKSGYLTEKNDNKAFQVNFFELTDEVHALYMYYDTIINTETNNSGQFTETIETGSNYAKYTAFSNGYYIVVIRIDNTLLFTKIEVENKQIVDNLLKDLGY